MNIPNRGTDHLNRAASPSLNQSGIAFQHSNQTGTDSTQPKQTEFDWLHLYTSRRRIVLLNLNLPTVAGLAQNRIP